MSKLVLSVLSACLVVGCGRGVAPSLPESNIPSGKNVAAVEVFVPDRAGEFHQATAILPLGAADMADDLLNDAMAEAILRSDDAIKQRALARPQRTDSDPTGVDSLSYADRVTSARLRWAKMVEETPDLNFVDLVFEEKSVVGFKSIVLPRTAFQPSKKTRGVDYRTVSLSTATGGTVTSSTFNCPLGSEINYGYATLWETNPPHYMLLTRRVNGSFVDSVVVPPNSTHWTMPPTFANNNNLTFVFDPQGTIGGISALLWCYYNGI